MLRLTNILIVLLFVPVVYGQSVRVRAYNNAYEKYRNSHNFDYVHDDFDSSKMTWVADITAEFDTVIPGMIGETYKKLKERANKFGANAFTVDESDIFSLGKSKYITMKVYWIRMEDRGENLNLHKENKVYLFGLLGYHNEIDGYEVALQDKDFIMHALTYREFQYPPKSTVTVQLGSKTRGTTTSFLMEENMFPKFFYFSMVKGSFKNAWIDEYSLSFGIFLKHILKPE